MPKTPITFAKACKIVQKSLACIVDGNALALSYPAINEDNGNDVIEVTWHAEDGVNENSFGPKATYAIDDKGCLVMEEDGNSCVLQFLNITTADAVFQSNN
jgi:hypothetical protein